MGRMLVEAILNADDCTLTGALDVPGSPALGTDPARLSGQGQRARASPLIWRKGCKGPIA